MHRPYLRWARSRLHERRGWAQECRKWIQERSRHKRRQNRYLGLVAAVQSIRENSVRNAGQKDRRRNGLVAVVQSIPADSVLSAAQKDRKGAI